MANKKMCSLTSQPASASLSPEEAQLLAAFRAADDLGREMAMHMTLLQAEKHPRARPRLCLVPTVNAKKVCSPTNGGQTTAPLSKPHPGGF